MANGMEMLVKEDVARDDGVRQEAKRQLLDRQGNTPRPKVQQNNVLSMEENKQNLYSMSVVL